MTGPATTTEDQRLAALHRYQLLDTPPEEAFDRITRIVKKVLDVPMVAIALVDEKRHWVKSGQGLRGAELPREITFCNDTIRGDGPLHVIDASVDARYADNPLVCDDPRLRFYAGVPLRSPDGHAVGTLCCLDVVPRSLGPQQLEVLSDLAHIVVDEFELRLVVSTDHLTGVMAGRAFRHRAEGDLAIAMETETPFSCIVFDVDLFKRVNDTYGHAAGDAVLKNVAARCNALVQGFGYVGRLGGEEFGMVLPRTGVVVATRVAEILRGLIADMWTPYGAVDILVTISAGVAAAERDTGCFEDILGEADRAVYSAKRAGGNLCVRSDEIDYVSREWACIA